VYPPFNSKSRVAYLNFWSGSFQPSNGGHLRAHHLFDGIQNRCTADFFAGHTSVAKPIAWTSVHKAKKATPFIIRVICSLYSKLIKGHASSTEFEIATYWTWTTNFFKGYDCLVFTSLDQLYVATLIRRVNPSLTIIFDAHNVEHNMTFERNVPWLLNLEKELYRITDYVFCCSAGDAEKLQELNNNQIQNLIIVPNGASTFNIVPTEPKKPTEKCALWIGSLTYSPNVEGLKWLLTQIAPKANLSIKIAGSGKLNSELSALIESLPNVTFLGFQEDLSEFYSIGALVVVPLLSGSGTRLKVLEAMSFAKCVVSTSKGCEGIQCSNGQDIVVCDDSKSFVDALNDLSQSPDEMKEIGKQARDLINLRYTWSKITEELFQPNQ
jgi:glycosyltransferase involved in cell wall biosynthesis